MRMFVVRGKWEGCVVRESRIHECGVGLFFPFFFLMEGEKNGPQYGFVVHTGLLYLDYRYKNLSDKG